MGHGRVLVTGAQGQLGRDLCRLLPEAVGLGHKELSITDPEAVRTAVQDAEAGVVCNCAAYNAVDAAEQDPAPARAVNADGPTILAEACREAGARLVHFSTNYVFSGERDRPAAEEDAPDPRSTYARSKLEGERRALEALPSALVVRCAGLLRLAGVDRAIERISTEALAAPAPRPRHGCLASRRVAPLRSWREGLAEFVREALATGRS